MRRHTGDTPVPEIMKELMACWMLSVCGSLGWSMHSHTQRGNEKKYASPHTTWGRGKKCLSYARSIILSVCTFLLNDEISDCIFSSQSQELEFFFQLNLI